MKLKITAAGLLVLFLGVILLNGCQTAAGFTNGLGTTVAYTAGGAAKDSCNLFKAIMAADEWMRENLW